MDGIKLSMPFGILVRAGFGPVDYDPKIRMRGAMQLPRYNPRDYSPGEFEFD